ncbi:polysaccharide deacetylase family protein [Capnocytophaga cynodegmi]|uniref:Nodulation protein B n=1 Tax=Capnocytophaga cynodegmi TaxID=28189 RepID=A0A0B7HU16_9FLAO|nr:polysaccharide deacetylase family protein [Capnocytophaga cynodegmi]CEN40049.1 Nodulation protein B [Capnocytophaga cynodegmi]CEN42094.1 Nodulation protein B [Capnocytophaga cynodegmi]
MIYLSFDIEEFDMPKEYGYDIDFDRQIHISREGLTAILDLLKGYDAKATFFSTVVFAREVPDLIERLLAEGHELASHTFYHSQFENTHLKQSKDSLEQMFGTSVKGLRMPRMAEVCSKEVKKAGYEYNSSVNPTLLPGRYNKIHVPKQIFVEEDLLQIPAAVSPLVRIPLFWLSFHNFPQWFYHFLLKRTMKYRGYATLYFHPWEFTDLHQKEFNFPSYVMRNSGEKMISRFEKLLKFINQNNWQTGLYRDLKKNEVKR